MQRENQLGKPQTGGMKRGKETVLGLETREHRRS